MRITSTDLKYMFERYTKALTSLGQDTENMRLDNYPLCGGYKIISRGMHGSELDVLSSNRLSTREMYYALLVASQTLEAIIYKKEQA